MSELQRQARAQWTGHLKGGQGTTSTGSGKIKDLPYSFASRFETGPGTNPEELLAAAHAACFSMMLAKLLGDRQAQPRHITTQATLALRLDASGVKITQVHLATEARVDGVDAAAFRQIAEEAKAKCPVSVLFSPGLESLTLEAKLVTS